MRNSTSFRAGVIALMTISIKAKNIHEFHSIFDLSRQNEVVIIATAGNMQKTPIVDP